MRARPSVVGRLVAVPLLLLLAACGGVSARIDGGVPPPHTIAVLPLQGAADPRARELTRALLQARLRTRGLIVAESAFTDRVLTERGWLRDPDAPMPQPPADQVTTALGVDAVLAGDGFDASSFNIFLLRRQAYGGALQLARRPDQKWWTCAHSAAHFGGLLLQSGQVLTELQAQGAHGTPMELLALVDEFVDDVVGTVPTQAGAAAPAAPALADVAAARAPAPMSGQERITVTASAPATASLTFDLEPVLRGVPMSGRDGRFQGAQDVPAGTAVTVRVHARDAFGTETTMEGRNP